MVLGEVNGREVNAERVTEPRARPLLGSGVECFGVLKLRTDGPVQTTMNRVWVGKLRGGGVLSKEHTRGRPWGGGGGT